MMGQYLNVGHAESFHVHKTHCSLIILSLEAINFDIKSMLNIKNVFYVKMKMSTFITKSQGWIRQNVVNQKKIKN